MIERSRLLSDLQRLLKRLEADLRERCEATPEIDAPLHHQWDAARAAGRTAHAYPIWREESLTQAAVAWILACVFVRFLEDNTLVAAPRLAGPGPRLAIARDHHTAWIAEHPTQTDRDYLQAVFRDTAKLPAMAALLGEAHNPLFALGLSADGARELLAFWQRPNPATGELVNDFTDPAWSTRFLGDLYQDLSESARKTYALLQTPEFVEEFILDRALEPAIQEFSYQAVRLIDPACGSGHFLLGAFRRLFDRWSRDEPGTNARVLAQRTLDALHGVDLNPFAVAIARFRLLLGALQASGVTRLADAPGFRLNLAVGDSLLHGTRPASTGLRGSQRDFFREPLAHVYDTEDAAELSRILGQRYHVVVGNPPYINPKDGALNQKYRERFGSCHMKYSLAVPFMERFFDLAIAPEARGTTPAGFVGMITANSFTKREFGKKLIEEFIPRWDLTHVIDTRAHIPNYGTPTVIVFARHRVPVVSTVRAVMGIRGESKTPDDPAKGLVWSAILAQIDLPDSQSEFVSVGDVPRDRFYSHPWCVQGGGAAELQEVIEARHSTLSDVSDSIGITSFTLEDAVFLLPEAAARRCRLPLDHVRPMVVGDAIRDWTLDRCDVAVFPYDAQFAPIPDDPQHSCLRYLWIARTHLSRNKMFGAQTKVEAGLNWYEFGRLTSEKLKTPLSIPFAFVATHNHFVLDRGGKVFNRTAPVIKLPADATEDDHFGLIGLLNSSTGCFWMKMVFYNRGGGGIGGGLAAEVWEQFVEHDGTKLGRFPVCGRQATRRARQLCDLAEQVVSSTPASVLTTPTPCGLVAAREKATVLFERMVGLQEELDWQCYGLYGLIPEDLCYSSDDMRLKLGERAFEIALGRSMAAGEVESKWFERHGSKPITEIPAHWPEDYRRLVQRRVEVIESNPNIALIEQPEYKRRWNTEPWEEQQERALRSWLLDRLEEDPRHWPEIRLMSCAKLADRAREDAEFMQVGELYRGQAGFDVTALVTELVEAEGVPFLPVLRYTDTGLRKRAAWEECWALQRREDAGEVVGEIAVPPKYASSDFRKQGWWRLRGKLDVPKERFILYPHAERDADATPVVGWAGWDALQQAKALAAYYLDRKDGEGWPAPRLAPLLAGLVELLPWLKQWHNDLDTESAVRMGDFYAQFTDEEARSLGLTLTELREWQPGPKPGRRRR